MSILLIHYELIIKQTFIKKYYKIGRKIISFKHFDHVYKYYPACSGVQNLYTVVYICTRTSFILPNINFELQVLYIYLNIYKYIQ